MRAVKMRVNPVRLMAAALAVALVPALAGCTGSGGDRPAADGPLNSGAGSAPSRGTLCAPARLGQAVTFGQGMFTNRGHATVVLDRVALRQPRHERLVGSYAVPGVWGIGVGWHWPPRYAGIPAGWQHRHPVPGFRVAPGTTFNMVLGVAATATGRATSRGMLVYYHDSAGSYVAKDDVGMEVGVGKPGC